MNELKDMMKPERQMEEISDRLVMKAIRDRQIRDTFNNQIYSYLREHKKPIGELTQEDVTKMSWQYPPKYQQIFLEQVLDALKTNRGKPIEWIKKNNKSILLNQLD